MGKKVDYTKLTIVSLILIMLLFISCAPKVTSSRQAIGDNSQVKVEADKGAAIVEWQQKWNSTLEEARKERKVSLYIASGGVAPAIMDANRLFGQKYGITLEVTSARGAELTAKLFAERASGLFMADIFQSGMNTNVGLVPTGALDSMDSTLILPEVTDLKGWLRGEFPWGDKNHMVIRYFAYPSYPIGINIQLVKPEEIKSYYDLLDPKWKGKIIINDPTLAGTAFNGFATVIYQKILDADFFRQLVLQEPVVIRDQRLHVDWLAKGKYPVALWPQTAPFNEYRAAGAPVAYTSSIKEGYYLSSGSGTFSLVNRAPHPNAVRVFINWVLSREGQTYMQKYQQIQSARIDISTEDLDPLQARKTGEKYFMSANNMEDWLVKDQDKYMDMAKQIFNPLIK